MLARWTSLLCSALVLSSSAWAQETPPADAPSEPAETPAVDPADEATAEEPVEVPSEPAEATSEPVNTPAPKPPMRAMPASNLPPPPPEDELPIPTLTIDRIPPSTSYEFAIQVSYGQVSYHRDSLAPWVGFGFRGGGGKNFGLHRVGLAGVFASEGDLGVHTLLVLEPGVTYDLVTQGGLLVGASVGPSFNYWADATQIVTESGFGVAPVASARVGWSQTWSRIGRRLFVFAEPKVRRANENTDVVLAVAIGSGLGR